MTSPQIANLGDFLTVTLSSTVPTMIFPQQRGVSVCLANQDITNPVTIGRLPNFAQGASNTATIPPLGSITVDGSKTLWGLAPAGTAPLLVMPGGGQWAPSPAQVAAQISALGLATFAEQVAQNSAIPTNIFGTGVPLYTKNNVAYSSGNQLIVGGGVFVSATTAAPQIGFELRIAAVNAAGAANNFGTYQITINWFDSSTGTQIDQDTYISIARASTDGTNFATNIKGPTKGDQFQIVIKNLESPLGLNLTVNFLMLMNSRFYGSDQIFLINYASTSVTNTGLTNGVSGDDQYICSGQNTALGAGATDQWLVPPNIGPVALNVWETGVAGANMNPRLNNFPNAGVYAQSVNANWVINDIMVTGAPNKLFYSFFSSGGPMNFRITNNGTVSASYTFTIISAPGSAP